MYPAKSYEYPLRWVIMIIGAMVSHGFTVAICGSHAGPTSEHMQFDLTAVEEVDWSTRGPRCNGQESQFEILCLKKDAAPRRNLCVCHSDTNKLRNSNQFIQTQIKYIQLDCQWRRITQLDASCEKTSGVPSCPHWADGSTNMARLAICTSLLEARGCAVSPVVAYLFDFIVQDCLEPILDVMYININNIHAIIHAEAIVIMIGKKH